MKNEVRKRKKDPTEKREDKTRENDVDRRNRSAKSRLTKTKHSKKTSREGGERGDKSSRDGEIKGGTPGQRARWSSCTRSASLSLVHFSARSAQASVSRASHYWR